ncbi:hypothetical protein [Streptomyces sp. MK7]|uniref:hypothetical protein n=1 Tax=Streptomyces sp. MK7 TaxID=3067635 RepID=UPI002931DB80|nr:hypothetical protein [Streptomyces sp. MK7]
MLRRSEFLIFDGFRRADVCEVEDVAFGDWVVVRGFEERLLRGVVPELIQCGVVVVSCRLAVGPPGVAFVDARAGQLRFACGAEAELIDDEDAGFGLEDDADLAFGVGGWCGRGVPDADGDFDVDVGLEAAQGLRPPVSLSSPSIRRTENRSSPLVDPSFVEANGYSSHCRSVPE